MFLPGLQLAPPPTLPPMPSSQCPNLLLELSVQLDLSTWPRLVLKFMRSFAPLERPRSPPPPRMWSQAGSRLLRLYLWPPAPAPHAVCRAAMTMPRSRKENSTSGGGMLEPKRHTSLLHPTTLTYCVECKHPQILNSLKSCRLSLKLLVHHMSFQNTIYNGFAWTSAFWRLARATL